MKRLIQIFSAFGAVLSVAVVLLPPDLSAQEAQVRVTLREQDSVEIWTGQKVTLIVDLLAPGYFASSPNFDLPDPEGMLLVPPTEHPTVSSETIDGVDYTVQTHVLFAFPMRAGDLIIPSLSVHFAFKLAPLDTDNKDVTVMTLPQPLEVKTPPGAEHLGQVISARGLRVEEHWKPEPGEADILAGTAFVRTVTVSAPDIPGMVLPPFPEQYENGLGIYPKWQLSDQSVRGTLLGKRSDIITYVCESPGQYTIPAVSYTWFDLDSNQVRTTEFRAHTLNVIANPTSPRGGAGAAGAASSNVVRWNVGLVLIATALLFVTRPGIRHFLARVFAPLRPVRLQALNPAKAPPAHNSH